jgi:hypothetical protein
VLVDVVVDLVEVAAHVVVDQVIDDVVGQRLQPAHQREARDEAAQVPGHGAR